MAAESSILKEYLVSLGFRVDEKGATKVEERLINWDKRAALLTKGLGGVAVAAVAMVSSFANSMERLYFSSKRSDATVGNLQALEYGASRVGMASGSMTKNIESFRMALRMNPGLTGLVNSLGIKVSGRDSSDVLHDLVTYATTKLPFNNGAGFMAQFGMGAEDFLTWGQNIKEIDEAAARRKAMAKEVGFDADAAAAKAHDFNNRLRETKELAGLAGDSISEQMLGPMDKVLDRVDSILKDLILISKMDFKQFQDFVAQGVVGYITGSWERRAAEREEAAAKAAERAKHPEGFGVELSKPAKERLGIAEGESSAEPASSSRFRNWVGEKYKEFMRYGGAKKFQAPDADEASLDAVAVDSTFKKGGTDKPNDAGRYVMGTNGKIRRAVASDPPLVPLTPTVITPAPSAGEAAGKLAAGREQAKALFPRIERFYALPPGILDRYYAAESGRGAATEGPYLAKTDEHALGSFQSTKANRAQYGVTDPFNLEQAAEGAAHMLYDLSKQFKGNEQMMAAGYNWGPGNVAKYGLGTDKVPNETRAFIEKVAPGGPSTINQTNNVTISGVTDPNRAAAATADAMSKANAELQRNNSKVQF